MKNMKESPGFAPKDPNYQPRVSESFARQKAMVTLGCKIETIEPGRIVLAFPFRPQLTQQNGFIHAGMLATAMDSACGYAALSLMAENAEVLAVEFKVNFLSPAKGKSFRIVGEVIKPGRNITVCSSEAFAASDGSEKLVARMTGTMMAVYDREEVA